MTAMQTILGAGGTIGIHLAEALTTHTDKIRLASRTTHAAIAKSEFFKTDLTNHQQVDKAVEGSEIVYLTAGIKYNAKLWKEQWPVIMRNTLDACRKHNAKLVFFDNVYAYGRVQGWMTEDLEYNPCSEKGQVRKQIAEMLMDAVDAGQLQASIVRAADFYGPQAVLSFTHALIFEKLFNKQKPAWLIDADFKHSLTYTPDAGKATALIGNTPEAYDQIWHLPTDQNVLSGKEFINLAAEVAGGDPDNYQVYKKWMLRLLGVFVQPIRESIEMVYQYQDDYLFDSSKFEKHFGMKATPYKQGIIETFNWMKKK